MKANVYAVYKGETPLCIGTAKECAEQLGVLPETIKYYARPAYQRRLAKRKWMTTAGYLTATILEDDE